ncbi:uncharacterized protein LOC118645956 [Monomorium pharaonis]|uniref:uncharacterized protein LOC118645956 n=1 Tax=Monomorium pharaonis TaxID=307658 RepID=UPI001745D25D|nr:uncharacterized protein LOC118645956 [Monomorium pharaonis]XP_036143910.1 uncharacterized protein LOC118645956 [Monomorium pharaonis]
MMSNCSHLHYNDANFYDIKRDSFQGTDTDGNETTVDCIYQFVKNSYSYQDDSVDYCNKFCTTNIIGPPEDLRYEYVKKTFEDHEILTASCSDMGFVADTGFLTDICYNTDNIIDVFDSIDTAGYTVKYMIDQISINIEYHVAVYPIRISRYGAFKLNDIIQIWAQNSDNQWFLLWNDSWTNPEKMQQESTLLSMPLHPCNFKTKMLRLVFEHRLLEENKLDAVMLTGTSELILPKKPQTESLNILLYDIRCFKDFARIVPQGVVGMLCPTDMLTRVHHDIFELLDNFHKHGIICKRNLIVQSFHKDHLAHKQVSHKVIPDYIQSLKQNLTVNDYSNYDKFIKDLKFCWDESKKSYDSFSKLCDETILNILKNLDLRSLCRVGRVNKRLNNLTRDPFLYTSLNVRNIHFTYWRSNLWHKFDYFAHRCKYLKQLDLSFCDIPVLKFNMFINTCGKHLTHLNLCCCRYVDDSALLEISKTCEILKELDLSNCEFVNDQGFSYFENLKYLERLHLQELQSIRTKTLCKILQRNQQLRDLNLAYTDLYIDDVTMELKNSCPNLETINLKMARITSKSIYALADCKNLREIDFGLVHMINGNEEDLEKSFRRLFSCLRLEKLDITTYIVNYSILESLIMMCKNLKSLTSEGRTVKSDSNIFQCPKLEKFKHKYYYKWRLNDNWFIIWDCFSESASLMTHGESGMKQFDYY